MSMLMQRGKAIACSSNEIRKSYLETAQLVQGGGHLPLLSSKVVSTSCSPFLLPCLVPLADMESNTFVFESI